MNPDSGVVHVRPDDMSDEAWKKHNEREGLVPLPQNRKARRAAAVLARRSVIARREKGGRARG